MKVWKITRNLPLGLPCKFTANLAEAVVLEAEEIDSPLADRAANNCVAALNELRDEARDATTDSEYSLACFDALMWERRLRYGGSPYAGLAA